MKKLIFMSLLTLSAFALWARSDTPCTDAWSACIEENGYPDAGCDAGWDTCMEALYDVIVIRY